MAAQLAVEGPLPFPPSGGPKSSTKSLCGSSRRWPNPNPNLNLNTNPNWQEMANRHAHEASAMTTTQCWREGGCPSAPVGSSLDDTVSRYTLGDELNPTGSVLLPAAWPRSLPAVGYRVAMPD